jgi:oligopeptide transport system substrate-binding protein
MIYLAFFLLLGSLGGGCTLTSSKGSQGSLRVQLVNEPISLDPGFVEDGVGLQILGNTMEGLVGYQASGQLENRLAESYVRSADGKTYEFTLRPGVRWSDGRELKVNDFIFAFRRLLNPQSRSKLAYLFFPIQGAQAYHAGKKSVEALGVKEINGKLRIELERKTPYFIHALTLPQAFPIRKEILDTNQGNWPEKSPSLGPYQLASHDFGQKITLAQNPYYWGKPPFISRVEFLIVTDELTGMNLFQQGKLDIIPRVPSLDFSRLKKEGKIRVDSLLATYFIAFNCKKNPFQDRRWRQAIAGAIQRLEITEMLGSGELPAWSWIPKGLEGYSPYRDPMLVFQSSIEWAKRQPKLNDAILFGFDSGIRNSKIIEKIQQDIQKKIGVSVTLVQYDWKAYVQTLQIDAFPLFRFAWLSPFADPVAHLRVFTSNNLNNYSGCSNPEYDRLVEDIEGLDPGPLRDLKIEKAQKILLEEESFVVPIYHYVQNTGVSSRIQGFEISPFNVISLSHLSWKEKL